MKKDDFERLKELIKKYEEYKIQSNFEKGKYKNSFSVYTANDIFEVDAEDYEILGEMVFFTDENGNNIAVFKNWDSVHANEKNGDE